MALPFLELPPDQNGYQFINPNDTLSVSLDGGLSRKRKDIEGSAGQVSVQWIVDLHDYQYLMAFYNFHTKKGVLPFDIELLIDRPEVQRYTVKFIGEPLLLSDPFGLSRLVTATLEVVPVQDLARDEAILLIHELRVFDIFDPLDKLVNIDLENDTDWELLDTLVNEELEV